MSDDYESTVENSQNYWCQKVYLPGSGEVIEQYSRYRSIYEPIIEEDLAGHVVITEKDGYQYMYKPAKPLSRPTSMSVKPRTGR